MAYFGTDGIRKPSGFFTPIFLDKFANALVKAFGDGDYVIARDPRQSGKAIEDNLIKSLNSLGINIKVLGMTATPVIAHYTRMHRATVGIMISASHNPAEDNGLKLFDNNGYKISSSKEEKVESFIDEDYIKPSKTGKTDYIKTADEEYIDYLKSKINTSLNGKTVAIDTANGATSDVARKLFSSLGCNVMQINSNKGGKDINLNCGAMHPETLKSFMIEKDVSIGFSFDGDGDRVVAFIDEKELDGDYILEILAKVMKEDNTLEKNTVIGTVMTNLGLENKLNDIGINLERVAVGDKNIISLMRENGYNLGGEQSGHIVCALYQNTGDGILIALLLSKLYYEGKINLSELFYQYPQILTSIRLPEMFQDININPENLITKKEIEALNIHVVIRKSGTEPVIRIMVQGKDIETVKKVSLDLNQKINGAINEYTKNIRYRERAFFY